MLIFYVSVVIQIFRFERQKIQIAVIQKILRVTDQFFYSFNINQKGKKQHNLYFFRHFSFLERAIETVDPGDS